MPSLNRAGRVAGRVAPYALVPVALSLLSFQKVLATARHAGVHVNVKFPLPADVVTLWTFVDPPSSGLTLQTPTALPLLPVFLAVQAVVVAGYLGGIHDAARDPEPDFERAAASHWLAVLGVTVAQFALLFGLTVVLIPFGPLAVVVLPVLLFVGYLLWGAPYLVVTGDRGAVDALAASVRCALDDRQYASFSVAFLLSGALASIPLSAFAASGGIVTVVVATAVVAYPALVASAAAMLVVVDADPEAPRTLSA